MKLKYNINFRLEQRKDKETGGLITNNVPINLDFTYDGKRFIFFTGYRIDASKWTDFTIDPATKEKVKIQRVKKNATNKDGIQYNQINNRLDEIKTEVEEIFIKAKANNILFDNEYLRKILQTNLGEVKVTSSSKSLFWEKWDEYVKTHKVSEIRKKQLRVTMNHLMRFEEYAKKVVSFETITPKFLADFEEFLFNDGNDESNKRYKPKSLNTVIGNLKRFRAFLNWCILPQNGAVITDNPFSKYQIKGEVYGAPICMTKAERDYLYDLEIKDIRLSRVRDIFCFQCLVGCRVGDLVTFTKNDIIDDILVYYPNKTKEENRIPARVPISGKAKAILEKYDLPDDKLLPYISGQKYNDYLKELFQFAELNRIVTHLNPLTLKKEQAPLSSFASSHLARRTFIHILHSKVKDSVIASMSGHVKGSKAFDRYYDVDDDTRQEAIDKYLD